MPRNFPLLWRLHGSLCHRALEDYPTWPGSVRGILGKEEEEGGVNGDDHFFHWYADEQSDAEMDHKYHEVSGEHVAPAA